MNRCPWVNDSPTMQNYHDREWGVPVHDDRRLFEFLLLEGAQAGLSWTTVDCYRYAEISAYSIATAVVEE
ncbi:MAG: DNA-3-methyladenine glycosylase I [Chloroflexi bacterium]|nr:DNA-3-methyladenine glycosylase I [Chloroflexota bacterium]